MILLKSDIHRLCSHAVYQRGNELYLKNKVRVMEDHCEENSVMLTGRVQGSVTEPYACEIDFFRSGDGESLKIADYQCNCPANDSWYGMCKHCVAICISYSEQLKTRTVRPSTDPSMRRKNFETDSELLKVLQQYAGSHPENMELPPESLHLSVLLSWGYAYSYGSRKQLFVEIKAGADRLYVVKSIPSFVYSVFYGTRYQYGTKRSVLHAMGLFDPFAQQVLQILVQAVREQYPTFDSMGEYLSGGNDRRIALSSARAAALMRLCMRETGSVTIDGFEHHCEDRDPPIKLTIRKTEGGAEISIPVVSEICPPPTAVYSMDDTYYFCSDEFQKNASPFINGLGKNSLLKSPVVKYLAEKDFSRFVAYVLPNLKQYLTVDDEDMDFSPYLPQKPEFRFYLSGDDVGNVTVRAEVCYGDAAFPLEVVGTEYRNLQAEKQVLEVMTYYFPHRNDPVQRTAAGEDEVYSVLADGLERLRQYGDVFVDDSLHNLRFAESPATKIGVALHGSLIDITVESEGYSPAEVNAILDAYRLKKKYYRLKSGEFLSLNEGGLSVVSRLSDGIDLRFDKNGKAQTQAFRAAYINSVLDRDDTAVDMRRNAAFKAQIMALQNYRDEEREIPALLHATLRGYQKNGYRWLSTLSDCSLGGILADDMGLGKTVQMLTYFLGQGSRFLVVCPASLIYNWVSECRRFAPSIACHVIRGTEEERKRELGATEGLTITSYDQLRRDIALYQKEQFDCCVLDEAQYIRNADTKTAKAVKQICATHRFALTGTPIENRLGDLWSIFDFLMPGYLFKRSEFHDRIEQPVSDGDEAAGERLARLVSPFILRRKKTDVLKELPDKQETVVYVEMTDRQRVLYKAQEQALRITLQNTGEAEFLHQKIEYLAALTRLRQICCTPELYLENYEGGSGKVEACMELLSEAAESGHRTLVFSQFTAMLELLIAEAEKLGLRWLYLSGKNTSEQRRDMVDKFQQGEYSVFFISLKAGGTGLNLTAADRVLHFDPWWNIAAEEQATDRTHRIGQKNKVLVTKLVCRDTIEDKIIALQEQKRLLSDMVMNDDGVGSHKLDRAAMLRLLQDEQDNTK